MRTKKKELLIIIFILIIQIIVLSFFATTKKSYYIDDLWTKEIAQGSFDYIDKEYAEKWNDTSVVKEKITLTGNERFNFKKVIKAAEKDGVHPPLYYLLINFFASLFNDKNMDTVIFVMNGIFSLGITLLLFLIFKGIYKKYEFDEKYRLIYFLPPAIWVVSIGTNLLFMLFRMYALSLFFMLALMYITIQILKGSKNDGEIKQNNSLLIIMFFVLTFGFLSHYYFSFISFLIVLLLVILLFIRKELKAIIKVGIVSIAALVCANLVYPYFFNGMFGSYHSGTAKMELLTFSFKRFFNNVHSYVGLCITNFIPQIKSISFIVTILVFLLIGVLIFLVIRGIYKVNKKSEGEFFYTLFKTIGEKLNKIAYTPKAILLLPLAIFPVFIVLTTGNANSRYMAISYPLFIFLFSIGLYKLAKIAEIKKGSYVISFFVVAVLLANSLYYVPKEYKSKLENLEPYFDYPVVSLTTFGTIPNAYSGDIESLADVFVNFPAEIHVAESLYFTNVLGFSKSEADEKSFFEFNEGLVKVENKIKHFPKYIRGGKKDKKLVVLVQTGYINYFNKIEEFTIKKTGLKNVKKLGTLDQFGFDFLAYVFSD